MITKQASFRIFYLYYGERANDGSTLSPYWRLYLFMVFALVQKPIVAENRSILIAAAVLIYMILFGHGLPGPINKNL